jgi:cyclic pyranopterin phosphate synthase
VLVTNGFLLSTQKDGLFHFVDKITISVYPSAPLKQELIEKIRARCAAESVELEVVTKPKFMISILGTKNDDTRLVNDIFNTCSVAWKNRCFTLHDGYLFRCSRAPFIGYKLLKAGIVAEDFSKRDGLKIEDTVEFPAKIKAYFTGEVPLESCAYCLGSVGKQPKHRQLTQTEIQRKSWTEYSAENSIDRIKLYKKLALWRLFHHR